jgi:hypothetical protein
MLNENDKEIRNKDSSDSSSLSKLSANLIAKEKSSSSKDKANYNEGKLVYDAGIILEKSKS